MLTQDPTLVVCWPANTKFCSLYIFEKCRFIIYSKSLFTSQIASQHWPNIGAMSDGRDRDSQALTSDQWLTLISK